jgi:hypothetical protein
MRSLFVVGLIGNGKNALAVTHFRMVGNPDTGH